MKKRSQASRVSFGAVMAAIVAVATLISIPMPGFRLYFNMGEGVIYTIALIFGPRYGALCGGLGASIADLILGYPLWAPFTLVIKGLEGYVAGKLRNKNKTLAIAAGASVMITGYTTMAAILYGAKAAPVELATDLLQTGIGAIVALVLSPMIEKRLKPSFLSNS
ncbi:MULTISPECIES: ECF transporter S component [Aminobacterium]|jgi:uncharacterized membrane protein|uniref:ECF transporter S component n=1 Tax=Aminobacterium TaxID=81466 RepID=UPI0025809607|nr:ECF transporter S component [Aminobacterium sp. UBA4987]MDD3768140.1 ECF transporter S component [Aminobacterium colombiense]